jgi:hypothetical protein
VIVTARTGSMSERQAGSLMQLEQGYMHISLLWFLPLVYPTQSTAGTLTYCQNVQLLLLFLE